MAKFTSASKKENGKAVTVTVDSLFEDFSGKADPVKLSKIFTTLKQPGTKAILTVEGNRVFFETNRADGSTLKAKSFPNLTYPTTGRPKQYKVSNIELVKTVIGV